MGVRAFSSLPNQHIITSLHSNHHILSLCLNKPTAPSQLLGSMITIVTDDDTYSLDVDVSMTIENLAALLEADVSRAHTPTSACHFC